VLETKLTGGCLCGAVRYSCETVPQFALNCHCRDCQRGSGTGYASLAVMPRAAFAWSGEVRCYSRKAESGGEIGRSFCPVCGSQLFIQTSRNPGQIKIHAGSLDDPSKHRPEIDIFVESAQPWDVMDPVLPKSARSLSSSVGNGSGAQAHRQYRT
jgi:hypothetical protein